jgi:hypothetical protein
VRVFLTSNAFRAADERPVRRWDWSAATILLISHDWNPDADSAEALAGRRLARALLEAGARVHVLAAGRPVSDLRFDNYDVTVVPDRPFPVNKIRRALAMIRSTIPEMEGPWVPGAVSAGLRVLGSLPPDTTIYGRAMPGVSNIVGWHLARMTGRPFVAHFSDEWPPPYVLSNGRGWVAPYKWPLFRVWLDAILRDAGALTFTNPNQAEDVLGRRGRRFLDKTFVVTHLPQFTSGHQPPQYDTFHIVHTGNLYPGRTSAALMQGLRLFLDRTPAARRVLRVSLAGAAYGDLPEWTERCRLAAVVWFAGRLSQAEVAALVNSASVLIAFDFARANSTTLLCKVPDYVNARRPILAITAPLSSMGRLFNGDGAGVTAGYDSPEEVAERVASMFEAWEQRRLDAFLPRPTAIASFDAARVLAELAAAFAVARLGRAGGAAARRRIELRPDHTTP